MKYNCTIQETVTFSVIVEANNEDEAEALALDAHLQGNCVFTGVAERDVTRIQESE